MDAACVALTRRAGGLIMGKTVITEFANRYPGKTMHPMDPQRTPGGSSSGSAAAVGASMVPLGVGTQTTASTIRPAAFCGCAGYRPTWGDLRCAGVMEAAGSLDTLGLIARSVEDVVPYRDVLLTPSAAGEAPVGLDSTGNAAFCAIQTTMHVPAMTLPLFRGGQRTAYRCPVDCQALQRPQVVRGCALGDQELPVINAQ